MKELALSMANLFLPPGLVLKEAAPRMVEAGHGLARSGRARPGGARLGKARLAALGSGIG